MLRYGSGGVVLCHVVVDDWTDVINIISLGVRTEATELLNEIRSGL